MRGGVLSQGLTVLLVSGLGGLIVLLLSVGGRTGAQQGQPGFDEEFMRMMHPVELARQFVTDEKLTEQIAAFKWTLFQEYQKKGFTENQAFELVLSAGIPFSASE